MPCPTVLPATDFSELLGRRVPVVAAPSGDATEVQGVGWDANGEPVWQACLGVQWHSAQTRPCAKRPWVLAQSRSAWQALQAQEAGAAAVVVPADELPTALAVLGIPVVVALNKSDINEKKDTKIDVDALSAKLGCPVIRTVSTSAEGLKTVVETAVARANAVVHGLPKGKLAMLLK